MAEHLSKPIAMRSGISVSRGAVPARLMGAAIEGHLSPQQILAPSGAELSITAAATLIAALGYIYGGDLIALTNYIVPTVLVSGLIIGGFKLITRDISSIWSPLFWNRVVLIAYFGVGSIVPLFVNNETKNLIEAFYRFFPEDVGKYNLIVCIFVLLYFTFVLLTIKISDNFKTDELKFEKSRISELYIGLMLLFTGLSIYYFIIMPNNFSIYTIQIPNIVTEIAQGVNIGIFLVALWALKSKSSIIYLIYFTVFIQFVFSILELNKSSAMFPLIMLALAYIYHDPNIKRIALCFLSLISIFLVIAPPVSHGRAYGDYIRVNDEAISFEVRADALLSYFDENTRFEESELQVGWVRLSYVNAATFAISQYDNGNPGDSLRNIFLVWIPRFLYPDKPAITDVAKEFNVAATGSDTSQSTPGIIGESYWVMGWPGVFIFSAVIAIISTLWSLYTIAVLRSGAWHLFFIVLLGMRAGSRLDGMFVSDVMGPLGYALIGHFVLQFLNRLLTEPKAPSANRLAV